MNPVVPMGTDEGKTSPVSLRVPEKLLARLDAIAKATNNSRTDVCLYLLRWAVEQYETEQSQKPKKSA